MNDLYSFYQLISKYQIEIPIIQRDYAQGRDNAKAADVRKSLIENMIKAAKGISPLFFDFVYGRIDGSKFIPFDGQQRLTTLFLFHKYVFEKCQLQSDCRHKENCICRDILKRFSYATRQSSREFCELLVGNRIIPTENYVQKVRDSYKKKLKDTPKEKTDKEIENEAEAYIKQKSDWMHCFIANQPWFFPDWEKDPTVFGMMTMLDEIHNQLKDENNFKCMAERLTSGCNCPITFHFVDMGEHKLSDETYVKMNARGKQLTPFENFKASLEQYLEENDKQDLLNRLKGQYEESIHKYKGIDGTWLDLFWDVSNKDKTEKELPDTLMMSFFNRHFINVWRCWYDQHQDTGNEKINKKIIDKMPLYPTKDDFVSWDVYNEILNKCGADECLIPIFNIWDILCEKKLNIYNCCQAVWNRGADVEIKKLWNFYTGIINNDNRETYPSRIAFYALMMYFKEKDDHIGETLPQWMRVVWNIIENSTIDSSEPYHAALRLIDKLSIGCHNIYASLAKGSEKLGLGDKYHAKEQVDEEIAKATKIDSDSTWEDRIKEAEKYMFFKGAIRFLFQGSDGYENWDCFDEKWRNAKEYFDEHGVKDGNKPYKTNALLMKALLAKCDSFDKKIWWHFEFSNDATRWKRILTSDNWRNSVDHLLRGDLSTETTDSNIKNIIDDGLMDFVCNNMSGAWIRKTYHGYQAIWQNGYPSRQVVLNPILSKLLFDGRITYRKDNEVDCTIEKCRYYKCHNRNVDFVYNGNCFQWWGNPNEKELDVYLMEKDWGDYKSKGDLICTDKPDEYNYFCFRVSNNTTPDEFCLKLDCLIAQAKANKTKTSCYTICQNKL